MTETGYRNKAGTKLRNGEVRFKLLTRRVSNEGTVLINYEQYQVPIAELCGFKVTIMYFNIDNAGIVTPRGYIPIFRLRPFDDDELPF